MTWVVACASLVGTWMNVRRQRACFVVWGFTNAAWAGYDFAHGLPAQGTLMLTYAGLAVYGFVAWGRRR